MQFSCSAKSSHKLMTELKWEFKHNYNNKTMTCYTNKTVTYIKFQEVISPRILLQPLQQQLESGLTYVPPGPPLLPVLPYPQSPGCRHKHFALVCLHSSSRRAFTSACPYRLPLLMCVVVTAVGLMEDIDVLTRSRPVTHDTAAGVGVWWRKMLEIN